MKNIGINVIPGEKICPSCKIKLMSFKDGGPGEVDFSQIYEDEVIELTTNKFLKENLNSSLTSMNISPLKMHAVTSHSRVALGKKKLLQAQQTVKLEIAKTLDISCSVKPRRFPNILSNEVLRKANDMDILTGKIKEKKLSSN